MVDFFCILPNNLFFPGTFLKMVICYNKLFSLHMNMIYLHSNFGLYQSQAAENFYFFSVDIIEYLH